MANQNELQRLRAQCLVGLTSLAIDFALLDDNAQHQLSKEVTLSLSRHRTSVYFSVQLMHLQLYFAQ